jgi:hypothetical protein
MMPELKNSTFIRAFSGVRPSSAQDDLRGAIAATRIIDHTPDGLKT